MNGDTCAIALRAFPKDGRGIPFSKRTSAVEGGSFSPRSRQAGIPSDLSDLAGLPALLGLADRIGFAAVVRHLEAGKLLRRPWTHDLLKTLARLSNFQFGAAVDRIAQKDLSELGTG